MKQTLRHAALAAGIAVISLASTASMAATSTYTFSSFFDTSTSLNPFDIKTLDYSVATLSITDIAGGVQLSLTQSANAFPAKSTAGTFIDALYISGPGGTLKSTSGPALASGAGYSILNSLNFREIGYSYPWNISFASSSFKEGTTETMTILGSGVNAAAFSKAGSTPMLNLINVGSPYNGLFTSNVHFLGTLVTAVPEAGTYLMMGLGLVGLAVVRRRRAS